MKHLSKLLCALLVVAVLCSCLVFTASASDFTPTATWESADGNALWSATKGTEEGNILTYLALNKTDDFNTYVITTAGDDSFANLVPKIDGMPTKDFQFTYAAGSNPAFTANAGNYYVVEFDLASESAFSESLYVQPLMRDANGQGYPFADKFYPYSHVEADGEWHHVVAIGDMGNNKIYYFVDGALVQTGVAYNKSYEVGMFNAVKVSNDVDTDYAYSTAQSNAIGNMSVRIYTSANTDAVAALAAAIANEDVSDVATSAKTGYPALATVDGVEYSSVNGVNAALNSPLPVKVELLRQFAGTITVNCDATVETNGFAGNVVAGEGVKVENEGTVYTYDAPFMTIAPFAETKDLATIMAAIKSGVAGNDWADIEPNGVNGATNNGKTGMTIGLTTDYTTGNQYLDVKPGDAESGSYFGVKPETWMGVRVYKGDENQYYVLDMDIAFYGNVSTAFGWFAVCRQGGGLFADSVSSGNFNASVNALEKGKFHHFTTILDFDNNKAYTFANGVLISTVNNGVYGGSGAALYAAADGIMFEQFRLFQSNVDYFAVDNVSIRKATDVSSTAAALSAGSLDNWNDKITYDAGYVAPIAKVDGEYVYSVAAADAALSDDGEHTLVLEQDFMGQITIDSTVTVNTNGLEGKIALAEPKVVPVDDGMLLQSFIITDNGDGTVTYTQANESNLSETAISITYMTEDYSDLETIYYTKGTAIEYVGTKFEGGNAIEGGKLVAADWKWTMDLENFEESLVGKTAADEYDGYFAILSERVVASAGLKYNLSLYSNFVVNIYVPKATATDASETVVTIDDVEYYVFEVAVDSTDIAEDVTFDVALNVDGTVFEGTVSVNILTYAQKVFNNTDYSEGLKQVIYAALEYANEAAKALVTAGVDVEAITDVLSANAEFATEDAEVGDSEELTNILSYVNSANLNLDAQPDFVLEMKGGYTGDVTLSYFDFDGEVVAKTFVADGTAGQPITLESMRIYEFDNVITITIDGQVGYYSLATYINGLAGQGDDTAFASALNDYAKLAKAYKAALVENAE